MSRGERQPPISKRNSYNGPRCCEGVEEVDTLEIHPLEDDEDRSASCAPPAAASSARPLGLVRAFLFLSHAPFGVMYASGPPQHW